MNEILWIILLILFIFIIKLILLDINVNKAINYIYTQENWKELRTKYLLNYVSTSFYSYLKEWLNPFKWTYKQMFKGLGRK